MILLNKERVKYSLVILMKENIKISKIYEELYNFIKFKIIIKFC